jgi:hypothetical protein
MTTTAVIVANIIADVALAGGLTYLMSRARRLTPHVGARGEPALATVRPSLALQSDGPRARVPCSLPHTPTRSTKRLHETPA